MSSHLSTDYDTVIIGAGVIGCASALRLSEAGHDVLVLEKGQVAGEATGVSAGLVAPSLFYPDAPELVRHSLSFFDSFDGTGNFEFTPRPRLEFIDPSSEADAREEVRDFTSKGLSVHYLEAEEVTNRYPQFDLSEFAGAIEYGDTGWVDPYTLTVVLAERAEDNGADVLTNTAVTGVNVSDGAVKSVATAEGTYTAETLVVAAGWRTRELLEDLVALPIRPYRTQCIVLDPGSDIDEKFPLGRVPRDKIYFRPEHNGDLLIGGGSAIIEDPQSASTKADREFRNKVARLIPTVFKNFDQAGVVEGWAGIDAATPDGRAIVDKPDEAPDGLVVATGFNGLGIMTAPPAASAVEAAVTGNEPSFDTSIFGANRFDEASTNFDLYSTFDMSH